MPLYPARSSLALTTRSQLAYPTASQRGELVYTTIDGDMVDDFGEAHYGFIAGVSETIYARNPWLALYDPILPGGLKVVLPVINKPTKSFLWDY